ncbi:carboxymuconolactone decarboxylase family protein [Gluconacetobacter aggeris]|uniref:carboxymuconolactone decarboxylase family protein n=1 Tax=Gluconacetobacter aggeris TaxID=1286186 RepID=UPI001FE7A302|nr:hypothetical protein [Gluconacetobacter aggeris]
MAETHAPDADFDALCGHFTDQEVVQLTLVIGMINHWNRIAIGFRWFCIGGPWRMMVCRR